MIVSLFCFLCTAILMKIILFFVVQTQIVFRKTNGDEFVKNDVELGQEPETLQKECMNNEVSLDKKGWREGLFCSKIYTTDICSFHAETRFCSLQIPESEKVCVTNATEEKYCLLA